MTAAALCLALNLYYEARGPGRTLAEWYAIAWVVQNRVESPRYPDTVCAVIRQPSQFSWTAHHWGVQIDGAPDRWAWRDARRFAIWFLRATRLGGTVDPTGGALHYAATWVTPLWSAGMRVAMTAGGHRFYGGSPNAEGTPR